MDDSTLFLFINVSAFFQAFLRTNSVLKHIGPEEGLKEG